MASAYLGVPTCYRYALRRALVGRIEVLASVQPFVPDALVLLTFRDIGYSGRLPRPAPLIPACDASHVDILCAPRLTWSTAPQWSPTGVTGRTHVGSACTSWSITLARHHGGHAQSSSRRSMRSTRRSQR